MAASPSRCYHYDYAQIKQLWINNGGNPKLADTMAAIALAETGGTGYTCSLNDNANTGDYSVGLWQINYFGGLRGERTARYGSPESLRSNPSAQAKAAIDLAQGGKGLHNWTTYTSNRYTIYLGSGGKGAGVIGAAGSAVGGAESAVSGAGSAVGGFISSLNPISGIEGAIKDLAMKFVYSLAIIGGGLLVLVGIILVGAELGIEQATSSKGGRIITSKVGGIGPMRLATQAAAKRGESRGYKQGFNQGEDVNEERTRVKEQKREDRKRVSRMKKGQSPDDIPF